MKIYLAGPEVFSPNAPALGAKLKATCATFSSPARGPVTGLFPLDNEIDFAAPSPIPAEPTPITSTLASTSPYALAHAIRTANMALIQTSDAVIANMAPFRGPSMDVGTAYEMGVAAALGKIVVGYSADRRDYVSKVVDAPAGGAVQRAPDGRLRDAAGWAVEDFASEVPGERLIDNLMMTAGGVVAVCETFDEAVGVAVRVWEERRGAAGTV